MPAAPAVFKNDLRERTDGLFLGILILLKANGKRRRKAYRQK
jgi:hypothetical protein